MRQVHQLASMLQLPVLWFLYRCAALDAQRMLCCQQVILANARWLCPQVQEAAAHRQCQNMCFTVKTCRMSKMTKLAKPCRQLLHHKHLTHDSSSNLAQVQGSCKDAAACFLHTVPRTPSTVHQAVSIPHVFCSCKHCMPRSLSTAVIVNCTVAQPDQLISISRSIPANTSSKQKQNLMLTLIYREKAH